MHPCSHVRTGIRVPLRGEPILADNFLPKSVPHWGLTLARGNHFWQPKSVQLDQFWQQKWSRGTGFGRFFAKISPAGPILGGTDFGVTALKKDTSEILGQQ